MTALKFRNDEITALLRTRPEEEAEGSASISRACDVTYALFLEPPEGGDPNWTFGEWLIDAAIKKFCPSPAMAHVELVAPPIPDSSGGRVHFATYLGASGAGWQNTSAKEDGVAFYLVDNGSRWRALPIFGANAAGAVREAAEANVHAPYSLGMYVTSVPPLRALAGWIGDQPRHKGHCAVVSARVLKEAGVGAALRHPSPYYSPSTLYNDLLASVATPLTEGERAGLTSVAPEECEQAVDTLLRAPMSYATVRDLGDAACIDAVRAMTLRVCEAAEAGDAVASRVAQKQLASTLLRWCLLRDDAGEAGAEAGAQAGAEAGAEAPESPNVEN